MAAEWARATLCTLGQGLELSEATVDGKRAHLHLGTWAGPYGNRIRWTGWISGPQLRRLYSFLTAHPELMEGTEPPEPEPPDELHPFS